MKNQIILFILLLSTLFSYSQNDFTDEVYPASGEKPYLNCKIIEVSNNNEITFVHQDKSFTLVAITIKRDGKYIDLSTYLDQETKEEADQKKEALLQISTLPSTELELYKGKPYEFYEYRRKRASNLRGGGIFLCFFGGGAVAFGISKRMEAPLILGSILLEAGIPIWITGAIIHRNNRKALEQFKNPPELSLNLGATENGYGLILKF